MKRNATSKQEVVSRQDYIVRCLLFHHGRSTSGKKWLFQPSLTMGRGVRSWNTNIHAASQPWQFSHQAFLVGLHQTQVSFHQKEKDILKGHGVTFSFQAHFNMQGRRPVHLLPLQVQIQGLGERARTEKNTRLALGGTWVQSVFKNLNCMQKRDKNKNFRCCVRSRNHFRYIENFTNMLLQSSCALGLRFWIPETFLFPHLMIHWSQGPPLPPLLQTQVGADDANNTGRHSVVTSRESWQHGNLSVLRDTQFPLQWFRPCRRNVS